MARCPGFSLLELAVVLTVLSMVAGASLAVGNDLLEAIRRGDTDRRLAAVRDALQTFRGLTDRLPCPADPTRPEGHPASGLEADTPGTCAGLRTDPAAHVARGAVPVRVLNLPAAFAYDGWGRKLTYLVHQPLTAPRGVLNCDLASPACGAVTVRDGSGAAVTTAAAYALVSHGEGGHGAYTRAGRLTVAHAPTADALTDCSCAADGTPAGPDAATVVQRPAVAGFDDQVVYRMRWQLQTADDEPVPPLCGLPWGGTVSAGTTTTAYQTATVPYGSTCASEGRVCAAGALSGSFGFQNCAAQPGAPCHPAAAQGGGTVPSGGTRPTYPVASVAAPAACPAASTLTCADGALACSTGTPSDCSYAACGVRAGCPLPWGGSLPHGQSATAYLAATAPYGGACVPETRTCDDGSLSGGYVNQSCAVTPPAACPLPWGGTLAHGAAATAYQSAGVTYGGTCGSEVRTCANGALSGSYQYQNCSVAAPASCTAPWGAAVAHGGSVTAYQAGGVTAPAACAGQTRTCANGVLSGSYQYQYCSVACPNTPATAVPSDLSMTVAGVPAGGTTRRAVLARGYVGSNTCERDAPQSWAVEVVSVSDPALFCDGGPAFYVPLGNAHTDLFQFRVCLAGPGTATVGWRIRDGDGAGTSYTATITGTP